MLRSLGGVGEGFGSSHTAHVLLLVRFCRPIEPDERNEPQLILTEAVEELNPTVYGGGGVNRNTMLTGHVISEDRVKEGLYRCDTDER